MEGKIKSQKAHIAFLSEKLEIKEKENVDLKNSIFVLAERKLFMQKEFCLKRIVLHRSYKLKKKYR